MGSLFAQKYEKYKYSGEGWIGEIPSHWEILRLKRLFHEKKHTSNMSLSCGAISFGEVVQKSDETIAESTKRSYQEVLSGDFLINPLNLNYDLTSLRIALSKIDVVVSAGYIILKESTPTNKDYFKFLLHRYDVEFMKLLGSGVRQTISFNHISDSLLIYPPLEEQFSISKFLNHKCSQIDQAVQIKEHQIELLKERRQILIQQAVTSGLNPDVPMRDSGIEWIGEIPAHWRLMANRALFRERVEPGQEELPLLSVSIHSGVSEEEIAEEDNVRGRVKIEDKTKYNRVRPGDIAFNMMRAWQGAIGTVRVEGMVSPAYTIAVPRPCLDPRYFEHQYRTPGFIQQMDRYSKGITDFRKRLYWDGFKQLITLVPPIEEQQAIVEFIEQSMLKQDAAVTLLEQQISKLKEYKATLINSAVTGKIKVPGVVEPETQDVEVV
jgi:type I restriction enzyme S subunit